MSNDSCPIRASGRVRKVQNDLGAGATSTGPQQAGDPSRGAVPVILGGTIGSTVAGCALVVKNATTGDVLFTQDFDDHRRIDLHALAPWMLPSDKSVLWPKPSEVLGLYVTTPAGAPDIFYDVEMGTAS